MGRPLAWCSASTPGVCWLEEVGPQEDAIAVSHYATAMQHAPNPRVGKRPAPWSSRDIGSFDRLEQIGEGMYGCERAPAAPSRGDPRFHDRTAAHRQVYKAHDKRTGELVALKKIKMNSDKEGVRRRAPASPFSPRPSALGSFPGRVPCSTVPDHCVARDPHLADPAASQHCRPQRDCDLVERRARGCQPAFRRRPESGRGRRSGRLGAHTARKRVHGDGISRLRPRGAARDARNALLVGSHQVLRQTAS